MVRTPKLIPVLQQRAAAASNWFLRRLFEGEMDELDVPFYQAKSTRNAFIVVTLAGLVIAVAIDTFILR